MSTPIVVTGNVGSVELKFTPSGKAVLNGSVAHNRTHLDRNTSTWVEDGTDWYRFAVWGDKAELYAEAIQKGQRVIVTGTLESREYETRDGGKATAWEIRVNDIGVVPRASGGVVRQAGGFAQSQPQDDAWAADGGAF